MVGYSFFIFTAVFCDYSFQSVVFNDYRSVGNSVVYADESGDIGNGDSLFDYSNDFIEPNFNESSEETRDFEFNTYEESVSEENQENSYLNEDFESFKYYKSLDELKPSEAENNFSDSSPNMRNARAVASFKNVFDAFKNDVNQAVSAINNMVSLTPTGLRSAIAESTATSFREIGWLQVRDNALGAVMSDFQTAINNHKNRLDALVSIDKDLYSQLGGFINKANARFDALVNIDKDLYSQLGGFINKANGRFDALIAVDNDQYAQIRNVNTRADALVNVDKDIYKQLSASITDSKNKFDALIKVDNDQYAQIRNVNTRADALVNADKDIYKQLSNSIADSKNKFDALIKVDNDQYAQIKNVNGRADELVKADNDIYTQLFATNLKIDSLSFDSSGIIKAINDMSKLTNANILLNTHATDVVRDSVNALNDSYKDSIYGDISSVEGGINRNDGDLTKMIKGQFSRLIKENEKIFFTDGKVAENEKDGYFVKLLKNLVYSMRYSMIAEFADFTDIFKHEMLLNRNNVSEYVLLLNKNLETANGWLDLIYNKKINVVIPPISIPPSELFVFDYDRLQEMFDNLNFGDMVNEAGTNLWDVLKSLVDGLFALADSVVGLAAKIWDSLFDNLMKLLIPNDPNFLSDKLSSVGDKFSLKFEGIFKVTDIFSNLFNVSPNDEFFNMKLNFNGTEFPLDFSVLKTLVETYKLRVVLGLLISISMWWDFYRKVTGTGDIIE